MRRGESKKEEVRSREGSGGCRERVITGLIATGLYEAESGGKGETEGRAKGRPDAPISNFAQNRGQRYPREDRRPPLPRGSLLPYILELVLVSLQILAFICNRLRGPHRRKVSILIFRSIFG